MPLDDEVSNESAIRRLLAMYCQFADDFRIDEWIELFTKDAELIIAELRRPYRSRVHSQSIEGSTPEHACRARSGPRVHPSRS